MVLDYPHDNHTFHGRGTGRDPQAADRTGKQAEAVTRGPRDESAVAGDHGGAQRQYRRAHGTGSERGSAALHALEAGAGPRCRRGGFADDPEAEAEAEAKGEVMTEQEVEERLEATEKLSAESGFTREQLATLFGQPPDSQTAIVTAGAANRILRRKLADQAERLERLEEIIRRSGLS